MDLILFSEYRFYYWEGGYWSDLGADHDSLVDTYDAYEKIYIVARVKKDLLDHRPWRRVDGSRVVIREVSDYSGIFGFIKRYLVNRRKIAKILQFRAAVILRGCSPQNILASIRMNKQKRIFGYEAVGDPRQVFNNKIVGGQLAKILKIFFYFAQKYLCRKAGAVHYVTKTYLQNIYPASDPAKMYGYSDVKLQEDDYIYRPRRYDADKEYTSLIFVGSLEQLYKGPHVLLRSIKKCIRAQPKIRLEMIGGGRFLTYLKQMAKAEGVEGNVVFFGAINDRKAIKGLLDKADLFVLPSLTEGLPRAMIEAMARGLPCIGTSVGGVVELLESDWLIPPDDVEGLAKKILNSLGDTQALSKASAKNLLNAAQYRFELVKEKREAFHQMIIELSKIH